MFFRWPGIGGLYTLRIGDVVLELGLANWLDISFMHGNSLPIWNAGLITAMIVAGFFRLGKWWYSVCVRIAALSVRCEVHTGRNSSQFQSSRDGAARVCPGGVVFFFQSEPAKAGSLWAFLTSLSG